METKELFYKHCDKKTLPQEFLGERFVEINLMDVYEFEKAIEEYKSMQIGKANQVDADVNTILAENEQLKEEVKEYNNLMMLQHKRIVEANKYWQEKLNKPKLLHSDLGNLLKFLMDRIDDLETINS